jgi:hypothetical protein
VGAGGEEWSLRAWGVGKTMVLGLRRSKSRGSRAGITILVLHPDSSETKIGSCDAWAMAFPAAPDQRDRGNDQGSEGLQIGRPIVETPECLDGGLLAVRQSTNPKRDGATRK